MRFYRSLICLLSLAVSFTKVPLVAGEQMRPAQASFGLSAAPERASSSSWRLNENDENFDQNRDQESIERQLMNEGKYEKYENEVEVNDDHKKTRAAQSNDELFAGK